MIATTTPTDRLRDHVTVLVNALELIRLADGDPPAITAALRLAMKQVEGLTRLADSLEDASLN